MSLISYSLGAVQEVTGSKHVLEVNGKIYLIDCGAWQGQKAIADEKNKNFEFAADKISAIIITHAHFDHVGLLPKLVKDGYKGPIYSTPATRDLANIVMLDSAKIQSKETKEIPIYNEKDVIHTTNLFQTVGYKRKITIDENIDLTFYDAGHILGSALAMVTVKNQRAPGIKGLFGKKQDVNILYSGDLGRCNTPIIRNPCVDFPAPDYMYLESTYGNRKHEKPEEVYTELERVIKETANRGGKVIIPSFAIERAQELVYYLRILMDEKRIPKIPVFIDSPMASNATGVFQMHPECYNKEIEEKFISKHKNPFSLGTLQCVQDYTESKSLIKNNKEPMIIIAANGMCEAGRIINHLQAGIEDPKNTILIVGFMGEGTLGRRILEKEKIVKIGDKEYNVNAEVYKINALSSHADKKEIQEWLKRVDTSKLKKIFLVHGEQEALTGLKEKLSAKLKLNVEVVKKDSVYKL